MALSKDEAGKINRVKARDVVSGEEFNFKTNLVINATGVFADDIARMDNPEATPTIKPSQGVHIVLDKSFLQSETAILIPKTDDGRVLFAIPWHDVVVVGTTDIPLDTINLEPVAHESEIDFILQNAEKYLSKPPRREDILCVYAGLRPLAAKQNNPESTKSISRRHKITLSSSGLVSIIGGKWTTYRRMAEETIEKAINAGLLDKKSCVTSDLKLTSLTIGHPVNRLNIYGDRFFEIEKLIYDNPKLGIPIDPRFPYTRAEIIWICRNEMPINIEDILARRTRALFQNARASCEIASEVAALMANESGYDTKWKEKQIEAYNQLVKNYI
jgi:glycerol-3-phosphate dehydrogenase